METSPATFSFLRGASLSLIFLTIALLAWQRYGMDRVYILDPKHGFVYTAQDDRFQDGDSVATMVRDAESMTLNCQLGKKYTWPYCQTRIDIAKMPGGIDLTGYDSVTFDISYSGPGPHTLRFYLRNFEPNFSNPQSLESLKVNEVEFPVPDSGKVTVPIKMFRVASWWLVGRQIPLMDTDMRIDNVPFVDVSTGSLVEQGVHRIEIRSIRFNGKWISQAQLMMALVGAWLMFGIIWLVLALQYFRANFIASKLRVSHLQSINQALALETKELAGQARTDPLTGSLNREGLRDFLMTNWSGQIPSEPPVSIIFADLDHFKNVNDQHGHIVGDSVLQDFSRLVQNEIRLQDRLVRWGGEEFLILCHNTDAHQGVGLAEKLRGVISHHTWPAGISITASFGVTMHVADEDLGAMILRADRALYMAKEGGRDRVIVI